MALGPAARADGSTSETARALFNEGLTLRARGDLAAAIAKLRAAHALRATPVTAYELARAYADHRELVEARDLLLSIKRMPAASSGESPEALAARRDAIPLADALKPRIPSLTVTLTGPGAAAKPTLSIDGVEIPSEAASEPQRVNPTMHHVTARATGAKEAAADVELREGESARIVLDLPAAATGSQTGPVTGPDADGQGARSTTLPKILTYGGFSLAFVGATVGAIAGVRALDQVSALRGSCTSSKICTPDQGDAIASARTTGNVATMSFVVAGVGAALGAVGILLWPRSGGNASASRASLAIGPTSVGIRGVFQ
jgi:hypothetical protein